ncbi:Cyclophilin type peptidyl-prolyl cis-trans isomerase/CLD [Babesia microti strain RI]|uniref:peptidylprolyl isomerase n=1 Tax=Babesia microti (strain RI) TaxID=1133968 RepID=A0A1R4ABD8_BABMR|nr:Cyclophilin type peptidyl-prolyl cis-trans isomerase/CLD [Babesia microti strain RI]SJK86265.1 Cyclophilin type peptidyl-prolyl cis-trans isomerase/CLD [Babesia microti strain RI]|eukprot:XP_021338445.1 Cyclophilin type peptidyl-prolyl cis-trans isomerase/CLD [Babesia microti strain RI]
MSSGDSIDLSGDNGVVKKILVPARSVDMPNDGQQVYVHYTGKLDNGVVFDSSITRNTPFNFTLGEGNVIKGWDICVKSMSVGEKCLVVIQPDYGYGDKGAGASIPPNSVLNFEIELLMYRDVPSKKKWEMSVDECIQIAQDSKIKGNNYFQQNNFPIAITFYQEAIDYLSGRDDWDPAQQSASAPLLSASHLNLANCYLKTGEYSKAIESSNNALKLDKNNVKAYYRRGIARMSFGFLQEACDDFKKVIALEPDNVQGKNSLAQCMHKLKISTQKEISVFSKMFRNDIYIEKKPARDMHALPRVFMDIRVNEKTFKTVIVLFEDTVPMAVKNFIGLCKGDNENKKLKYKGNKFHKLVPGVLVQGGDVINNDGTGGMSIYGEAFIDESFNDQFATKGIVGMANTGPNTNLSQFFITLSPQPSMNGKNVVIGKIVEGLELLDEIKTVKIDGDKPKSTIEIVDCGTV